MPITLEQSKVGMTDKIDQTVTDLFRRESDMLDAMVFDNAISPGTGGSTLGYAYVQLKTPSTCKFRKINEEYTAGEALREKKTAEAKIFGGKFGVDRVLAKTSGAVDEVAFQMAQKVKGAVNLFNNTVINGDSSVDEKSFDGLNKMLKGTETEYIPSTAIDISDSAKMTENAELFLDTLDEWLGTMEGRPDFLVMNGKMKTKFKSIARKSGYYTRSENSFGKGVDGYDGIPFYEVKDFFDGTKTNPIIDIDELGETSIFAVTMSLDGFHGISPVGDKVISTYQKDVTDTGVILDGEVEAIMGVVLKNSRKAGVLRKIKIKAPSSK